MAGATAAFAAFVAGLALRVLPRSEGKKQGWDSWNETRLEGPSSFLFPKYLEYDLEKAAGKTVGASLTPLTYLSQIHSFIIHKS